MAGGGPAFYQMYLAEQRKQPDTPIIPSLRLLSGGGAPKPPEMYNEVMQRDGHPGVPRLRHDRVPDDRPGRPATTPRTQLMYTDGAARDRLPGPHRHPRGAEVAATGADGEVRVKGPMVFKGYTDAGARRRRLRRRGLVPHRRPRPPRPDGHVVLTGRLKDVIIRKGENISAKEIEDLLYQHPKVGDVAVIGLPDRERGERVCAVVETATGAEPPRRSTRWSPT